MLDTRGNNCQIRSKNFDSRAPDINTHAPLTFCVRIGGITYFFKVVDETQPQPTKRELQITKKIKRRELASQNPDTPRQGGFTGIEDQTPLILMLDTGVAEMERDTWARESRRTVGVLHRRGIVWGDAKAGNFVVDRRGWL
ncbi:hypothetical protein F5X99DRAFT_410928 [Biscogniauxia marginata]|nr:hypothetical protein F5X99DRAFT_410928 [Biscogniauxia marginata]